MHFRPARHGWYFVLANLLCVGIASAQSSPQLSSGVLVNSSGLTLYTFDKDVANSGKSQCYGPCSQLWPPAIATSDTKLEGALTVVKRDDGSYQWAYQGKPLYTYAVDKSPGDVAGDNYKGIWHIIK